jgi:4-hydroxy-tetrahydrodipicolinate reductase
MKIALIGYGKMGQAIASIAIQRGHHIAYTIDVNNQALCAQLNSNSVDVALEFSDPKAAYKNIYQCLAQGVRVVAGTTGWLQELGKLEQYCREQHGTFFYASNFSMGANIFFKINQILAKLMSQHTGYNIELEELHHITKKDVPSGTAITLAEDILAHFPNKKGWTSKASRQEDAIPILSKRHAEVIGMHQVTYQSSLDSITIKHTAHSRQGFALGAILVAEWLQDKTGVLTMDDFLKLGA